MLLGAVADFLSESGLYKLIYGSVPASHGEDGVLNVWLLFF